MLVHCPKCGFLFDNDKRCQWCPDPEKVVKLTEEKMQELITKIRERNGQ